MKLLTGRLLTSYLFNVRKYQNFLFFNLNSYTGDWPLIISFKKINLNDNDLCSFCQLKEETLIHLFWNCTVTSSFWDNFKQWLLNNETSLRSLELTSSLVVGLKPHPFLRKYFYYLFLVERLYICTCRTRCTRPTIDNFPLFLSHYNL